ncbi:MAG: hypothetical protein LBR74_03175 [Eubacterium sp.]|jgi:hypothetical protein|nr:hypothetical protein [Eubacterium sp.]
MNSAFETKNATPAVQRTELSKGYKVLFNGVSDTIKDLESIIGRLAVYQQIAEDMYMDETL